MKTPMKVDICVIGGGSGGLSVAAGASQLGVDVALVERDLMGGDCLNFGCVPSKALLAAGKAAYNFKKASRFGIFGQLSRIDSVAVRQHVRDVIASIAPHDSVERFQALGVKVIKGTARFTSPCEIVVGGQTIISRRFVIATGSLPKIPPIPGLDTIAYLTNETIFDYGQPMDHLIVVGGGPIGAELAQAYRRLGSAVTVIEIDRLLPSDDEELAKVVQNSLAREGIRIRIGMKVNGVAKTGVGVAVRLDNGEVVEGSHLLLSTGRRPNIDELNLEAAGVNYSQKGITVNAGLRTSNRKIYAIGDVAGGLQFTHVAGYHAGVVIRSALFRLPAKIKGEWQIPRVTYTDPELAHIGIQEEAARLQYGRINILRFPFAENDRALTERDTTGMIKVVTARNGKILGTSIVGPHAGDLLQPWILAVNRSLKIGAMAGVIWPYPTFGEVGARAAISHFIPKLINNRTKSIVRLLAKFG